MRDLYALNLATGVGHRRLVRWQALPPEVLDSNGLQARESRTAANLGQQLTAANVLLALPEYHEIRPGSVEIGHIFSEVGHSFDKISNSVQSIFELGVIESLFHMVGTFRFVLYEQNVQPFLRNNIIHFGLPT